MARLLQDKSHKMIQGTNKKTKKRLKVKASGIILSLLLFSGYSGQLRKITAGEPESVAYSYEMQGHDPEEDVKLGSALKIVLKDGTRVTKLKYKDLENVSELIIKLYHNTDYTFLNYMTGLEKLHLVAQSDEIDSKNVDLSRLTNIKYVCVSDGRSYDRATELNDKKFGMIRTIPHIETLEFGKTSSKCFDYSGGFATSLTNVENLKIYLNDYSNLNDVNFKGIKSLTVGGEPYNLAMFFYGNTIDKLREKNIEVTIENEDQVRKINEKVNKYYESLDIKETDNQVDRLDKILTFILGKFQYDQKIKDYARSGKNFDNDASKFYAKGSLDAALTKPTQICGNYAALTYTLGKMAGLDTCFVTSVDHAWNTFKFGDYDYYVDSTWLDEETENVKVPLSDGKSRYEMKSSEEIFRKGYDDSKWQLFWYIIDPNDVPNINGGIYHHTMDYKPEAVNIEEIPKGLLYDLKKGKVDYPVKSATDENLEEMAEDLNKSVVLEHNNKMYVIPAEILASILLTLGIGINYKKEKTKSKQKVKK